MRRWNGWGEESVSYPLPPQAGAFLRDLVGPGRPQNDAHLQDVLAAVPASRLPTHNAIDQGPLARLQHARGQSLPDWVALRSGRIPEYPDGVAWPVGADDIGALINLAARRGAVLIPYGGGTSVVGHINAPRSECPVLTIDLRRLNRLLRLDREALLATFGAGVSGPELEAQLRAQGFTLGHFPQSFELSTLGGWIATRSSGQQSLGYGRIEDLFAGGSVITPAGLLTLPPFPASAAGPDLRHLVLGSEGRLGIIGEATLRIAPLPEAEEFHAVFFPDFEAGLLAAREMAQAGLPLSLLRLSTPDETTTTLALAGHQRLLGLLDRYLTLRGAESGKVMLLLGFTGRARLVRVARKEALGISRAHQGVHVGQQFGKQWQKGRFHSPYLRNTLWDMGYAIDTLETAVPWSSVLPTLHAVEGALDQALALEGERAHVFSHLSHFYSSGASIYTTILFRLGREPEETMAHWRLLKGAASAAIVAHGGTISHQHGVGEDHAAYLPAEKGELGMALLQDALQRADPRGLLNPGKLLAGWQPQAWSNTEQETEHVV